MQVNHRFPLWRDGDVLSQRNGGNKMKVLAFAIITTLGILVASCSTMDACKSIVYARQLPLTDSEKWELEKKTFEGDGYSALKLAKHEHFLGDKRLALQWYGFARAAGYKREFTQQQIETLKKEGVDLMIYGAQFSLCEDRKEEFVERALAGDGYSAYRLAKYEYLFGDVRKSIRWYKEAYRLGYMQEHCLGSYRSLEKHLEDGVFDRGTGGGSGSESAK